MSYRPKSFVLALSIILVISSASALGQIRGGIGGIGGRATIGGARPGTGGVRGLSSPRSGLGIGSNPIVNPAPSLTPHEVLNPRGSLSSGQVLNPAPSLRRPRSGGPTTAMQQTAPATRQAGTTGGSARHSTRPSTGYSTPSHFDELTAQLRRYKNGQSWADYLALPKELLSDETTERASEQASKLLKRFDKLGSDPAYAKVTALPAFWLAYESLKLKVDPKDPSPTPSAAKQPDAVGGSAYRSARPSLSGSILRSLDPAPTRQPVGDRILQTVAALDARIAKVAPEGGWTKRLSLDELRVAISVTSEQPASDDERKTIEDILGSYQAVAKNKEDAVVNGLPEFKQTLQALQEYLSPLDARRRQDLSLNFDQLGDQLRKYKNGESWAKYLAPPKELLSDKTTEGTSQPTSKLLKRFDKLSSDPTYAKVTALPAFEPAYESLKLVVHQTDPSPPPAVAAKEQPVAAGDPQPVAAADKKPAATADKESDAAGEMKPVSPAPQTSIAAADKKPVTDKPVATAEASPNPRPSGDRTEPPLTDPAPMHQSVGERILKSVVALDARIAKVAPDKGWQKRLSLDELEVAISMTSDQPASDSDRKSLEEILEAYQTIAKNKDDAVVNQLPEFKETLQALQEYLKPRDAPRKDGG